MNKVHNDHYSEDFKFERKIAKSTQSNVLNKIFPDKMSYSQAEKETGTDKANIQRATKGHSLLNAAAFSKILVKAYSLRSVYEVRNHISNCIHLHHYLEKELGDIYKNPNYQNKGIDYALANTVTDAISKEFYALLYAHKKINGIVLKSLYGEEKANELIFIFSKYNVIKYHKAIDIVEFLEDMVTTSFLHNKKQLEIIASNCSELEQANEKAIYAQDTILISRKNVKKAMTKLSKIIQEYTEYVNTLESEDSLNERTQLMEYSIIGHQLRELDINIKGLQ